MITHPLLAVGLLLILGYWGGRVANMIRFPRVSGYLVAGILISPSFSNILSRQLVDDDLFVITEMALAIIAYSIGGSLVYARLKRLGKSIPWITLSQAIGAFLITTVLLVPALPYLGNLEGPEYTLLRTHLPLAIIIGAICISTAPGAVLSIISEFRAGGVFTTTLLGVIAISDGLAIIFFAFATAVSHALINPGTVSWTIMLGTAIGEIVFSLLLGIFAGTALLYMGRSVRRKEALLMVILGVIFTASGAALLLNLSPLLTNMVVGFLVVNRAIRHHDFFHVVEHIEEPLFGLFFGLAGAHLDLHVLTYAGPLAVFILVTRMIGKQLGTWIGAKLAHAQETVAKYLGLALFPQAGVTIGLVLTAQEIIPSPLVSNLLVNAILGTVILNELIAPPLIKYILLQVGELPDREDTDENR